MPASPEKIWEPLSPAAKDRFADWLARINRLSVHHNNWNFFRVLVNLGLDAVGRRQEGRANAESLARLDGFYRGDGWYSDGNPVCDYYVPFAFHFYGLIYAVPAGDRDPRNATRFKDRAAAFAHEFIHFFSAEGAAIPYGRSLTYRFAQGAFWGALAYAGVEVMEWGMVKGMLLRNLRWWLRQSIFDTGGVLTIGYGNPNLFMAEAYSSASSPYWAMKAFLPLALPESHPFWQSEEKPLPALPGAKVFV